MAVSHVKALAAADWTGVVTVFNSQGSSGTVNATDLVRPSDWNSDHAEYFTLTGNTTGDSTFGASGIVWSGAGAVTLGGTDNTVVISGPDYISILPQGVPLDTALNTTAFFDGTNKSVVSPFLLSQNGSFSYLRIPGFIGCSNVSIASSGNSYNVSFQRADTWNMAVYSLGTGASSRSLIFIGGGSIGSSCFVSLSVAAAGTRYSVSHSNSFFVEGAVATLSTSYTSVTATNNPSYVLSSSAYSNLASARYMDINFTKSLPAGEYWVVWGVSSASLVGGPSTNSITFTIAQNVAPRAVSFYCNTQTNAPFGVMGQTNFTSAPLRDGAFSTTGAGSTILTNAIPYSAVSTVLSQPIFLYSFMRQA